MSAVHSPEIASFIGNKNEKNDSVLASYRRDCRFEGLNQY